MPLELTTPEGAQAFRDAMVSAGWPQEMIEGELLRAKKQQELVAANPNIHPMTAIIMAGDLVSADRQTAGFEKDHDPERAWMVGSFARWQWALDHCPQDWLSENLPALWSGSDPNDTDPRNLAVWLEAWRANGRKPIIDGGALPKAKWLTVYRGQLPDEELGIAWSLSLDVADKFAKGAGSRVPTPGVVYRGTVARDNVLAYMTGRNEKEVILNPVHVKDLGVIRAYELVKKEAKS